jgi:hypothetical protein
MNAFIETHKYLAAAILFVALCAGSVSSAHAEDVAKGVLIVRGGTPNTSDYATQEQDINGKLERVSALCAPRSSVTAAQLVATDNGWAFGANYMSGSTTDVIKQGGKVVKDPLPGNPNHCLINGLKLGQIRGIWH